MRKKVAVRVHQFQECLSKLGKIECRPLFGGYSLAIDKTVFAMMAEGEIYLRACEQSAPYNQSHTTPSLHMKKKGYPVFLNYYQVDELLWQDNEMLFKLSLYSLQNAVAERNQRESSNRLKDLPNITLRQEISLMNAGITDKHMLCQLGAEKAWLKLREQNKSLNLSVLYLLEGAITGYHVKALPKQRRQELDEWVEMQRKKEYDNYSG